MKKIYTEPCLGMLKFESSDIMLESVEQGDSSFVKDSYDWLENELG